MQSEPLSLNTENDALEADGLLAQLDLFQFASIDYPLYRQIMPYFRPDESFLFVGTFS